jgi:hypothetical protein
MLGANAARSNALDELDRQQPRVLDGDLPAAEHEVSRRRLLTAKAGVERR